MDNYTIDEHISKLQELHLNNYDLQTVICVLRNLTDVMKNDCLRSKLTHDHWNSVVNVTKIIGKTLNKAELYDEELDFLADFLRFLRNSCAGCTSNQHFVLNSSEILSCGKKIINSFRNRKSEKELIVLKCALQMFGNLVCCSSSAKSLVWNLFLEENIFMNLFEHEDQKAKEYAMMVLYNCMSDEAAKYLIGTSNGHLILSTLVDSLCTDLIDWGILFLEFILKQDDFIKNCYETLSMQSRLLILDIIIEQLSNTSENACFVISYSSINYLKDLFIEYVMDIVQICGTETTNVKPVEITKLLCLLCDASVSDTYSHVLKSSRQLLEMSLDTLKCVHLLGKKSYNAFSCISNLKVTSQVTKEEIECNPSYGFKKNLIRLIGNLSYNCKENQDLVRKLDGIPLLLDCCNLDARNPFIMQWCILAIRNILEKNVENQAILAGVSVTGDLVDSALIRELGFEIQSENGKYVLKSLHVSNSS